MLIHESYILASDGPLIFTRLEERQLKFEDQEQNPSIFLLSKQVVWLLLQNLFVYR